jgi:hypothetical protein
MSWHRVLATHEEKQVTSLGPWPGDQVLGCALPSPKALHKRVYIRYNGRQAYCEVLDVGPWAVDDEAYVFGHSQPRAEILKGELCPVKLGSKAVATVPDGKGGWRPCPKSNGAGIDLFPATALVLGIKIGATVWVDWCFADEATV